MADYTTSTYMQGGALPSWAEDPSKVTADQMKTMAGTMQGATTYQPTENALVSSQLTKLLKQDNPYTALARSKAAQYANSRGLLNSSMAAGAGERAAIESALPVAQGDAQAYGVAERDNAAALNNFSLDANRFQREGALSALRAGFDSATQQRNFGFQAGESAAERAMRESQFQTAEGRLREAMTQDNQIKQADLGIRQSELGLREQDLALRRDSLDSETQLKQATMLQEMQRTYMDARIQLETTANLDQGAKATAIQAMDAWFVNTALKDLRASLGDPAAWPDFASAPASSPAPAPASPQAPAVPIMDSGVSLRPDGSRYDIYTGDY